MTTIFSSHLNDDTQNKNVRQLIWHLYVDTAVEDSYVIAQRVIETQL